MRLRRLDLTRYGKFTNKVLDFGVCAAGRPDFHLVYGANGAGKSTAFDAYLSLLFGIEPRSSYGFQHDYKAMLIGGCIETEGRVLELLRTKGNLNDLRTANGEVLPPGTLGQILGSLTRASYRSMFSLDNVSLADGGKAILESKGELGMMLFAASSGLSHVSKQLGTVRELADALYKTRSSKTKMRELLDRLTALKEQHKLIEVAASRFEDLQHVALEARTLHEAEIAKHDIRDKDLRVLRRTAVALPLVQKRERLMAELAPLACLPIPQQGWLEEADQFATDEAAHLTRLQEQDRLIARIEDDLKAIVLNQPLLNAAKDITNLSELQARYTTAALDLPKRKAALAEEQTKLASQLSALGNTPTATGNQKDAVAYLIDVQTTAQLTALADTHAALAADAFATEQEVVLASEKYTHAKLDDEFNSRQKSGRQEGDRHHDPMDTLPLQTLLGRVRRENTSGRLNVLLDEIAVLQEQFTTACTVLKPSIHTPDALAVLDAPSIASIERLAIALKQVMDTSHKTALSFQEKQVQVAALEARTATLMQQANITDPVTLAALAQERGVAWQAHLDALDVKTLNPVTLVASAAHYGAIAKTERSALNSNQREGEKLGEWRAAGTALAEAQALLSVAGTRRKEALAAQDIQQQILVDALVQCQLPTTMHADDYVLWLTQREHILSLDATITRKQVQSRTFETQMTSDKMDIMQSLNDWGMAFTPDAPLDTLLEQAQRALTLAATTNEKREGAARLLDQLQRELNTRHARRDTAQQALVNWQEQWALILSKTWLARQSSVGEVRAVLRVLEALTVILNDMAKLSHQIDSMVFDQTAYTQALEQACNHAGHAFDAATIQGTATSLDGALAQERQKQSLCLSKEQEAQEAHSHRRILGENMQEFSARRDRMLVHYGVSNTADLQHALRSASHAANLRPQVEALEMEIIASLRTVDLASGLAAVATADLDATEADIERFEGEQASAQETLQTLHHNRKMADDALAAVTSNDKAARLLEERRTVGLEIEDMALRYLRLRIGADAVEGALRRYRDQHRSSMMQDAASRFERITRGSFTDLKTQVSDKGESLLGIQPTGGSQLAEHMSQGERDQLFLALRMAGYVELAKNQPALPFVADDIIETFDNERAAATFALLEEMSHHGQVIYFTHHEHLCDIARTVCGDGVRITQL